MNNRMNGGMFGPKTILVFKENIIRGCDQIMRVGFTLLDLFPDITDRISSI